MKPPLGAHPPEEPLLLEPINAPAEIFFRVSCSPQLGQAGIWSDSEKLTILSKDLPHLLQVYSYKGIYCSSFYILPPSITQKWVQAQDINKSWACTHLLDFC